MNGEEPCEGGWEQAGFKRVETAPRREGLTLAVRVRLETRWFQQGNTFKRVETPDGEAERRVSTLAVRALLESVSRAIEVRTADETVPRDTPHTHSSVYSAHSRLQTVHGRVARPERARRSGEAVAPHRPSGRVARSRQGQNTTRPLRRAR